MAKAADVPLHPDMPFAEAARAHGRACAPSELWEHADERPRHERHRARARHARRHAAAARGARDLRARRSRTTQHRAVLREVKALADALGERRDPDVQLEALRPRRRGRRARSARRASRAPSRPTGNDDARAPRSRHAEETDLRGQLDGARRGGAGVKARKVKGLDPAGALADNAERIVAVRLDELCAFAPAVVRPRRGRGAARHAHRRQAPALRPRGHRRRCFGPYAATAGKRTRSCRTCSARSTTATCSCRACSALARRAARRGRRRRVPRAARGAAAHARRAYRGLELLVVRTRARREELFAHFLAFWTDLEREGFRARLEYAIAERPPASPTEVAPHDHRDRPRASARRTCRSSELYFNRELSWLDFNARVLELAEDDGVAAARAREVRRDLRRRTSTSSS